MEGKQKVALTFALYRGESLVRREIVTQDIIKVGRDPKSHLRIDDDQASRMHAVIEVSSADDITVIDLGNDPGTLLNGARITKSRVTAGDRLQFGTIAAVLERAEAVVTAAAGVLPTAENNPFAAKSAPVAKPMTAPTQNPFDVSAHNPFMGSAEAFAMPNPFGTPSIPDRSEVAADAPEGSYTYALVKSAPDLVAEEVEDARASAVEILILWDTSTIHVQHLTPPRSYYVGEEEGKNLPCDFFIPAEKLGVNRAPIVLTDRAGQSSVVLLPRATGTIELAGQPRMTLEQAISQGKAQPCAELAGAHQVALTPGSRAKVDIGGLIFQVSVGNAGRAVAGHFQLDSQGLLYQGISLAVHAGLLAAMAFFMPPLGNTAEDGISPEQTYLLQQYLKAAAERELESKDTDQVAETKADDKEGGSGDRSKGEEGKMGSQTSRDTNKRYAIKGDANNADPHIARRAALEDAHTFGMIGILASNMGGDPNAPTAIWGREDSSGRDPLSYNGNMWGATPGEAAGSGGLGLTGIGDGGGGLGEGIGLGDGIGGLGHGRGNGFGDGIGNGNGSSHGRLHREHRVTVPKVGIGTTSVSGRLPPEVIQRIVRQNFGRFRLCYENGLRSSPNLSGRVSVRFVIGHDGATSNVANGGSDLPDSAVVSCVTRAFYGLSFPQPEGGIVTVTYPIIFTPGT